MAVTTESFTGSNSATLAGATIDRTWSDVVSGWSVASNQAAASATNAVQYARCEVDVGSDDHFVEAVVVSFNDGGGGDIAQAGITARYSSSANTCYQLVLGLDGANEIALRRTASGARTTMVKAAVTRAANDVIRLEVEGTAIRGYLNGVLAISTTDATITTGQRGGLYGYLPAGGAVVIDTWRVGLLADLAAGTVADAGRATGTGTANSPTVTTTSAVPTGNAAGTGAAQTPSVALSVPTGSAAGTGTANAPTAALSTPTGNAAGTGAALDPTVQIVGSSLAGNAAGTGTANSPTVTISSATPTGNASGTGAALAPAPQVGPATGTAAGTGAALAPTVRISVNVGVATGSGTANQPTAGTPGDVSASVGMAAGTGAALNPTVLIREADRGSWGGLLALAREARNPTPDPREAASCPNDGFTLLPDPRGGLRCPFDGFRR